MGLAGPGRAYQPLPQRRGGSIAEYQPLHLGDDGLSFRLVEGVDMVFLVPPNAIDVSCPIEVDPLEDFQRLHARHPSM